MYKELVDYVLKETIKNFPELKMESELLAALTHWMHEPDINFSFRSPKLIQFWKVNILDFCDRNNKSLSEIKSSIPFLSSENKFDFIDLFAGIGGFKIALEKHGGRCVFSSEWDKAAKITYFNNYGKYPFGDINQFTGSKISDQELDLLVPNHRILAGGFPCQPFSHAGVSARGALGIAHGFDCETQGTLFHSIARIAYVKQPEVVFMENVKNIVTHNKGETFKIIRETMQQLSNGNPDKHSYVFHYEIINSDTVVAQRRNRCFMVCIREDIYNALGRKKFTFPSFEGDKIPLRHALEKLSEDEIAEYTISDKLWQGHIVRTQRNVERNTGFTAHEADLDKPSNTIVARYGKDGKECLIPQVGMNPRKLTKKECANLFGYPDGFLMPESKTPAYKQFGNSVVVPVVAKISERIVNYLNL